MNKKYKMFKKINKNIPFSLVSSLVSLFNLKTFLNFLYRFLEYLKKNHKFQKNSLYFLKISYLSNENWHFHNVEFKKLLVYSAKLVKNEKKSPIFLEFLFQILKKYYL